MDAAADKRGLCRVCHKEIQFTDATKHFTSCLEANAQGAAKDYFLLLLDSKPQWMYVALKKSAKMSELKKHINRIWMECCGHISSFGIRGSKNPKYDDFDYSMDGVFRESASAVLKVGEVGFFIYDQGSSTELDVHILGEYPANKLTSGKDVVTLMRNRPPQFVCCNSGCTSKGAYTCIECFQINCSKHKKCCGSGSLGVANSPRMGVCGYESSGADHDPDER